MLTLADGGLLASHQVTGHNVESLGEREEAAVKEALRGSLLGAGCQVSPERWAFERVLVRDSQLVQQSRADLGTLNHRGLEGLLDESLLDSCLGFDFLVTTEG